MAPFSGVLSLGRIAPAGPRRSNFTEVQLQRRSLQTFQAQLDHLIYKRRVQRAKQSSEPVMTNDLFTLAAMSRLLNEQLVQLTLKLQAAGRRQSASPPLSREDLKTIEQLHNIISILSDKVRPVCAP